MCDCCGARLLWRCWGARPPKRSLCAVTGAPRSPCVPLSTVANRDGFVGHWVRRWLRHFTAPPPHWAGVRVAPCRGQTGAHRLVVGFLPLPWPYSHNLVCAKRTRSAGCQGRRPVVSGVEGRSHISQSTTCVLAKCCHHRTGSPRAAPFASRLGRRCQDLFGALAPQHRHNKTAKIAGPRCQCLPHRHVRTAGNCRGTRRPGAVT